MATRRGCLEPLELELHEIVSHTKWVMGMELKASARVASTLNFGPSLQTHISFFF